MATRRELEAKVSRQKDDIIALLAEGVLSRQTALDYIHKLVDANQRIKELEADLKRLDEFSQRRYLNADRLREIAIKAGVITGFDFDA